MIYYYEYVCRKINICEVNLIVIEFLSQTHLLGTPLNKVLLKSAQGISDRRQRGKRATTGISGQIEARQRPFQSGQITETFNTTHSNLASYNRGIHRLDCNLVIKWNQQISIQDQITNDNTISMITILSRQRFKRSQGLMACTTLKLQQREDLRKSN